MNIIDEIAAERKRQIEEEGWTPEHDDEHVPGEMALAAASYAAWDFPNIGQNVKDAAWPWDATWWKPKGRRRNLIRAAALLVAEIERLERNDPGRPVPRHGSGPDNQ